MKNKPCNADSEAALEAISEEAFEKPFDFSKAVPNPYVNHAREARAREAQEQKNSTSHREEGLSHASR